MAIHLVLDRLGLDDGGHEASIRWPELMLLRTRS
jgi:hypothetical protein